MKTKMTNRRKIKTREEFVNFEYFEGDVEDVMRDLKDLVAYMKTGGRKFSRIYLELRQDGYALVGVEK